MATNRRELRRQAREIALEFKLDPDLFDRQIAAESNWNPRAVSRVGAQGLGQLMPGTASELGVTDPFDPTQNLRGAASYMRKQLDAFGGDYKLALAAYNAGPGNVQQYNGVPPFSETQDYVAKILGESVLGRPVSARPVQRSQRQQLSERKHAEVRPTGFLAQGRDVFHTPPMAKNRFFPGVDDPTNSQIAKAAAIVDNDILNVGGAVYRDQMTRAFEYDPDFRITPEMLEGTPVWHDPGLVATAGSQEEFDFLMDWYGREWDARQVLMRAGWKGIAASMLSGVLSPVTLFSFGAGTFTRSMLRGSMVGARAAFLGTGISEAGLHLTQAFRTPEETLMGVTAGTVFGGALGAGGGALGRRAFRSGTRKTELLQTAVLDPVIQRDGVWFKRNQRVAEEIERGRSTRFAQEGADLTDDQVVEIYQKYGDQVTDEAELNGLMNEDGRLLLSAEALEESQTVTRGFDPTETAEQAALRNMEERANVRAIEEWSAEVEGIPLRQTDELTDGQIELVRRMRETEELEAARAEAAGEDPVEIVGTRADDIEQEFRIRAGVLEELAEIRAKGFDEITPLERARAIYLRRLLDETQDPDLVGAFEDLVVEFGLDPGDFRVPAEPRVRGEVDRLAELDAEGHVATRVREIRLNDAEVAAERGDPDLRGVAELEGIGAKTVEKLASAGVHTVEDLTSAIRAGKKLPGISDGRARKILGENVPRSSMPDPLVPREDPIAQIVSQAYGFENLRILHFNPQSRILVRSPSRLSKKILSNLGIVDFKLAGNYAGEVSDEPVELGIKIWHRRSEKVMGEVQQQWRQYAMGVTITGPEKLSALQVRGRRMVSPGVDARVARLNEKDFFSLVTRTLRNHNRHPVDTPAEAIQHVEAAARAIREQIWLPISQELEFLGKAARTDPFSYVLRVYDTGKIRDNLDDFTRAMVDDLAGSRASSGPPTPGRLRTWARSRCTARSRSAGPGASGWSRCETRPSSPGCGTTSPR
jgi:hypothetical protein